MYIIKEIFAVLIVIHVSEAQQGIYSPEGVDMSWTNNITEECIKHRYVESPIFDTFVGKNNHSMALLMCEHVTESYQKRCDLIIRTHSFNDQVHTKICKIHPPSEDDSYTVTPGVTFLRGDRVLVFWKEQHKSDALQDRMKSKVLFTGNCKESDFIHVDGSFHDQIIRFKNFFYIIFRNRTKCQKPLYCTVTYSYDGESLYGIPLLFPIEKNDDLSIHYAYTMNYGDFFEGPVLTGNLRPSDSQTKEKEVFSPIMGWINVDDLLHNFHVFSNSSGFATICWKPFHTKEQFHCKWLDGNHGDKTLNLTFKHVRFSKMPQIYNTPDGTIMLIAPGFDEDLSENIFIDEANIDAKCKRIAKMKIHKVNQINGLQFSMPQNDRFCVSYVTHTCNSELCSAVPLIINYRFVTKCGKIDTVNQKYVECGHGYFLF